MPVVPTLACFLLTASMVLAQWQTQTIMLKPGWNAVYLHVDASHVTLDSAVGADPGNPIAEVWMWNPVQAADRFISDPQTPVQGADWSSWDRAPAVADTLIRLIGNAACLVRNGGPTDHVWFVKGRPVPPRYEWTSKGVNLLGFATPAVNPPLFANFLLPAPQLAVEGQFFRYDDGNNDLFPSLFTTFNTTRVNRGQAYWIRHVGQFNRYFAAFEVALQNSSGIHFGSSLSQYALRIRNQTAVTNTVTLALVASEAAPVGETAIAGLPALLLRGALVVSNLTHAFTNFSPNAQSVRLSPAGQVGSEIELILGVNRQAMAGDPSTLFAGILRLTDSLGFSQIDLPVSANPASTSGLWVGSALVTQVRHYLKNYERDANDQPALSKVGQTVAGIDAAGLVLELRLDEGRGTVAGDSAPVIPQRPGTLMNEPTWLAPALGPPVDSERSSLGFFSATQSFVEIQNGPVLGSALTLEAWIYPTANGPGLRGLIGFDDGTDMAPSLSVLDTNKIHFGYTDTNGDRISAATESILTPAAWNHVAVTYGNGTVNVYVNGVRSYSNPADFLGKPPKPIPLSWIGRVGSFFDGRIAQVRVWEVARTEAQIQGALFKAQLTQALGQYAVTHVDTRLGDVARPFPLRLIIHRSPTETRLLQRVYHGIGPGSSFVITTRQALLHPGLLAEARRISAAHLPWSEGNPGWLLHGQLALGQTVTGTVVTDFGDHTSNPFLHSFHPDHDNLSADFSSIERRGAESYEIERRMTLNFTAPGNDFAGLTSGGNELAGQYLEEIILKGLGNETRRVDTAGAFLLKRISDIPVLQQ